ncbi:unnamed protein product [Hydatigera taeniaeformis]|uniref:RING-type domain-containing protein n=1 Tax=Hydatigena taeniaeformis TaxID=6205 RepID=A0A158RDT4_HYDTA|nr:unnamed protein product [Hydatigera taeniaeformis]
MAEVPSSNPASSNGIVSDSAQSVSIGILDAEETRRDNLLVTKPPLSPVPTHQSQFSHRTSASSTLPRVPPTSSRTSPPIGAVASLAISGGMSQDELLRLGQNRPLPVSIRSTRAAAVVLRGGGVRGGPRRGHHTAPPGTVHIGRVTRVARCDICLSPPSSALCSFNPSPRGSPLHLTRVGGIIADTNDRKSSLPVLPTDQLVRVGPGTVVSTRGQSYARINWYPQPYKSASIEATSTSISPPLQALPNPPSVSGVQVESAISSQVSMLSDGTDIAESSGRAPISPDGHSTSSGFCEVPVDDWRSSQMVRQPTAPFGWFFPPLEPCFVKGTSENLLLILHFITSTVEVPMGNLNLGSCPIPSTSEEAVHFFGSSYTASTADSTTVTATTSTMTAFDAVVQHSPPKGETTYQQRLYHQHIARSVRNLRRFRHIYGDSLTSVLASTKAPSSEERENSTSSIPSMQHRRSSADEALIARAVGERDEPSSPPSPPPSSAKLVSNLEQRRRRRHLFISHRSVHSESQRQAGEAIPVATVIVALESDENIKPSKSLWLHRRCFVYNGCIFLISLTENVTSVLSTKSKVSW